MKHKKERDTINEESYTEESVDNSETDNIFEETASNSKEKEDDKGDAEIEKCDVSEEKIKKTNQERPKVTLKLNNEEIEVSKSGDVEITKDITDIENDAVRGESSTVVKDLIVEVADKNSSDRFESVGSQCDIVDPVDVAVKSDDSNDKKNDEKSGEAEIETSVVVRKTRKFDVVVTKPDSAKKVEKSCKQTPDEQKAQKDIDSATHDEVLFDDVFGEKASDDEHSKTITNESELHIKVIVNLLIYPEMLFSTV